MIDKIHSQCLPCLDFSLFGITSPRQKKKKILKHEESPSHHVEIQQNINETPFSHTDLSEPQLALQVFGACKSEWEQTVVLVRWCSALRLTSWFLPFVFLSPVAHHDPENTFNCSFIEPPSVAEQPSPSSWSSQESFSSFESRDEGPVYCVPNDGESSEE